MSENLHNIDDLFKSAIDEHEDTPSEKVWDAIDKNLDKKKVVSISKKYNKLKWAAAILLLFSSGMAMYVWQTRMKNKELVEQNNFNKARKTNKESIQNDEKKSPPEIKPETEKNSGIHNNSSTNSNNQATVSNIVKEKVVPVNSSLRKLPVTDKQKSRLTMDMTENGAQTNEATDENNKKQPEEKTGSASNGNARTNDSANNFLTKRIIEKIPLYNNQPWNSVLQLQGVNPLTYKPGTLTDQRVVIGSGNKTRSVKKNMVKSTASSLFSATIFFSPEFVSNDVQDDHPRYREDDRHQIKNSEHIRSSVSYGVLLNYNIGNNWSLQSGASLFARVTDINGKTVYARPDNGGNVNFRISCSAGSAYVPLKSGATPAQGDSTKILSAKNSLQYISIPLTASRNIGQGKFNLVAGAGVAVNILAKRNVETVMAATGGNETSSTNNIEGLKSAYFNSQVSLGAQYNLSKKIALNFTPTAKLALSSINKDAAVKTKLNSFGLAAGITIKF